MIEIPPRSEAQLAKARHQARMIHLCRSVQAMHRAGWTYQRIAEAIGSSTSVVVRYASLMPFPHSSQAEHTKHRRDRIVSRTLPNAVHKEIAQSKQERSNGQ